MTTINININIENLNINENKNDKIKCSRCRRELSNKQIIANNLFENINLKMAR